MQGFFYRPLLVLVALLVLMCCDADHSVLRAQAEESPAIAMPAVPSITGEIVHLVAAPDFSLVALVVDNPDESAYEVIFFDPEQQRIIKRFPGISMPGVYAWSPDSRRFAVDQYNYEDKKNIYTIKVFDIKGTVTTFPAHGAIYGLLWNSPASDVLLYYTNFSHGQLVQYELAARKERVLIDKRHLIGLFRVQGKVCVAYLHERKRNGHTRYSAVTAMELATRKTLFTMPFTDPWYQQCDDYLLDVSPDGRYFFLNLGASGWLRNMVANTEDAGVVNQKLRYAVMLQDGFRGGRPGTIQWSPFYGTQQEGDYALVSTFLVTLTTGNTASLDDWPIFVHATRGAAWWKRPEQFIYVDQQGLRISNGEDPRLVLMHNMAK